MHRLLHRKFAFGIVFAACALCAGACSKDNSTTTTPTTPTPTIVTDTFTGSINRNGAATQTFAVGASGSVTATLKSLAPDNTIVIGFSLGTWNGAVCQIVLAKDNAVVGNVINGTASSLGTLCVRVYDVGNVVNTTSYEIEVSHP